EPQPRALFDHVRKHGRGHRWRHQRVGSSLAGGWWRRGRGRLVQVAGVNGMSRGRILITGASSGIGEACAIRFPELGYTVFAGVRKPADGDALRAHSPANIKPVLLDVTLSDSIQGALAFIGDEPLAGLVNNAGIALVGPLELISIDRWRRQFDV